MQHITQGSLIASAARRWAKQYPPGSDPAKLAIGRRLAALDPATATAEEIDAIVGNASWTNLLCDECNEWSPDGVRLGEESGFESATARVCRGCIVEAYRLIARGETSP